MSQRTDLIRQDNARSASIDLERGEESLCIVILKSSRMSFASDAGLPISLKPGERFEIEPLREHRLLNSSQSVATYLLVQSGPYSFVVSNA